MMFDVDLKHAQQPSLDDILEGEVTRSCHNVYTVLRSPQSANMNSSTDPARRYMATCLQLLQLVETQK
jgi:hypothetical protein